jgi:hypothetical protein
MSRWQLVLVCRLGSCDPAVLFAPPYRVEKVGRITTSGVMTVHDFGWVGVDLAPLSQRVPAGTYPVLVSHRADGVNAAVRVRFSDEPVARWVSGARVGSDNQVIVDAGSVVVLDFTTMPRCRNERIVELYQDHLTTTDGDVFSIGGGPDDAVVVQAGYGDGLPGLLGRHRGRDDHGSPGRLPHRLTRSSAAPSK